MADINERYVSAIPSAGLTAALANTYEPVRVDPGVEGPTDGDTAIPVTRVGSNDNADEVFGQYMNRTSPTRIRVKVGGLLILKANTTYDKAVHGQGVRATGSVGVVEASGTVGVGFGRIVGGGTIGGVNVYRVYVQ